MTNFIESEKVFMNTLTREQQDKMLIRNVSRPSELDISDMIFMELTQSQENILKYVQSDMEFYASRIC